VFGFQPVPVPCRPRVGLVRSGWTATNARVASSARVRHGGSIHAPRRAEIRRASAGEKTERVAIGVRAETKTLTRGSACALWHETRDYDVSLSGLERSHYFMTDTKRVRTRNVSRRQRDTPLHDASVFDGSSGLQQDRARDVLVKKLGNRQGNARANGPETPTYLEAYATNVKSKMCGRAGASPVRMW
jgi:hypothetical protein